MTRRIARSLAGVAVAAAIALVAGGSAVAQLSGARLAARDGLTNRHEPPVSETDGYSPSAVMPALSTVTPALSAVMPAQPVPAKAGSGHPVIGKGEGSAPSARRYSP